MHTHIPNNRPKSSSKSTPESSTPVVSQSYTNSDNILALQQLIGNQATRRLLQPQLQNISNTSQHIQRADDTPQPIVEDNDNIDRNNVGILTDQPEMRAILDELASLAKSTASGFNSFREGGYESTANMDKVSQPTQELGKQAFQANKKLAKLQHRADTGGLGSEDEDIWAGDNKPGLLEQAHSFASRIKWSAYLQSQLNSEELTLLQQAFAFTSFNHKGTMFSLFGLPSLHIEHNYEMTLREAENWITTPHEIIMKYSNNIGMSYEKTISFGWLGGGASLISGGASKAVASMKKEAQGQFQGVIDEKIEEQFGKEPSFSEKTVKRDDAHDFWLPSWFEDAYISQFAAFAKAGYKHVLADGLPSANVGVHVLTFDYGSHALAFDLSEDIFQIDPSLPELKLKTIRDIKKAVEDAVKDDPNYDPDLDIDEYNADELKKGRNKIPSLISGELEADWDVLYKVAYNVDGKSPIKKAEEIEIDFDLRTLIDPENPAWQTLVMADIFFDTGQAEVNAAAYDALVDALGRVRKYLLTDPEARLRFMVFGKASREWQYLKKGEKAAKNNLELSELRANTTLSMLQAIREQVLGDILPEEIDDKIQGDPKGAKIANPQFSDSSEALGHDKNAFWSPDLRYQIHKDKKRADKEENDPTERGASIRISVRPTPLEQKDPDAELKASKENPSPKTIGEIAVAQATQALNKLFNGNK